MAAMLPMEQGLTLTQLLLGTHKIRSSQVLNPILFEKPSNALVSMWKEKLGKFSGVASSLLLSEMPQS